MTKSQAVAKKTNETNRCARIARMKYSEFRTVAGKVLKSFPHHRMIDVAEEIAHLKQDEYMKDIVADYNPLELAELINDIWEY